ncbi:MAG: DUF3990 domain-containing protein [Clostridiales bacterium]|nr:DUF3990 domain-containing protein [Clostridiales bacterium]
MILYHGSKEIVQNPIYGKGKTTNDYGSGFYLTPEYELGCEWSASSDMDGYVNEYEFNANNLTVLNLNDKQYSILHWLAMLVQNRSFGTTSSLMQEAKDYLIKNFSIDKAPYDYIVGYRADDSYFSFARDFLSSTISLQKLAEAMKLGRLGIQYVLISPKAFDNISFIKADQVNHTIYYSKRMVRDEKARKDYITTRSNAAQGLYMLNILQENILPDDKRLYL